MGTTFTSLKELRVGKFVIIDGEPCKVVDLSSSAPGKHGSAKMRIVGVGIFDNQKRMLYGPASDDAEVPILERKRGQILSYDGTSIQIMDTESYETFDLAVPEDMRGEVDSGKEIEYFECMGRKLLTKISNK
jgi:translation initiation factor 5A